MRSNSLRSFLIAMLITGVVLVFIYVFLLFANFNLAGGETLEEIENQRTALLVITALIFIFTLFIFRSFLKQGKKPRAYGTIVLPALALIVVAIYFISHLTSESRFDKTVWMQSSPKPLTMAAALVKGNKLLDLTKQEVKTMLGQGDEEYEDKNTENSSIRYSVTNGWTLTVSFKHDKVSNANLRLAWLGI